MERNYKLFKELSDELHKFLQDLAGFFADSLVGHKLIVDSIQSENERMRFVSGDSEVFTDEFQDTCIFSHDDIFGYKRSIENN